MVNLEKIKQSFNLKWIFTRLNWICICNL